MEGELLIAQRIQSTQVVTDEDNLQENLVHN